MRRMVMVGLDPSHKDGSALSWATQWCRITEQELLVVTGFEAGQAEVSPDLHDELLSEAHRSLDAQVDQADIGPLVPHLSRILEGDPASILIDTAKTQDPSLVVLGSRGGGGFAELPLGGVAHHVTHHLVRPIAIVPQVGGAMRGGSIVVGAEGSVISKRALRWAADAARVTGSSLEVVVAGRRSMTPGSVEATSGDGVAPDARDWSLLDENQVRAKVEGEIGQGVEVTVRCSTDHPVPALCEIGHDCDASMIVVGSRGAGGFLDLILGRVAAQLLQHADRPVVLIHPPGT